MKIKLRTKMISGTACLLIFVMLISTVVVSIIVNRQNRQLSNDLINKSFTITNEFISQKMKKQLLDTAQMATRNEMGAKVKYIRSLYDMGYSMLRDTYRDIAVSIYDLSMVANFNKSVVYNMDGNLIAIIKKQGSKTTLGIKHEDMIEIAEFNKNEDKELTRDSWEKQDLLQDLNLKFHGEIPATSVTFFKNIGSFLGLVSYVPIMGQAIDVETDEMVTTQLGFVTTLQILDKEFVNMVAHLAGTDINIFTKGGLGAGSLKEYEKYDLSDLAEMEVAQGLENQEAILNDVNINGKDYFQGVLPVFSDSDCIAAIVSLYSKDIAKANTWEMIKILSLISVICILVFLPITYLFSNSMTKPISKVAEALKDIAEGEGDLTSRLEVKNMDEVGGLAHWFNTFIIKLQEIIKEVIENSQTLDRSSSYLSDLSEQMTERADQISTKTNTVSSSSEVMSSNMDSVATAMEEASTNIGMVASAVEEMTSTIGEIARNSEKGRLVTVETVSRAQATSVKVDELGKAAMEINKVTEAITEISDQTNLLALNATIEAARAGEAGKGFAVVANEIKDLARQTSGATQEIKSQIVGIQSSTTGTVSEIEEILKVINDVNDIVSTIAAAVEEQSVTSKEIATNVSQASQGIQEVNENLSRSSSVSSEISRDIGGVNEANSVMSNSCSQVYTSSSELSNLAKELGKLVNRFRV